jgi:hypothetical protein
MFLAEGVAVAAIVKVAVKVVEFTAVTLLIVMPPPFMVNDDVPARLVPVMVTGTTKPRIPVFGVTPVSVGAGIVPWNSIAPMSIPVLFTSGLLFPKKSVVGAIV